MTDNLMASLEACPFCGATMAHCTDRDGEFWMHPGVVTDDDCFMSGQGVFPRQLELWNRRAALSTPPTVGQEVPKLERWGFKWQGHDHGTHERMDDGYWTPWHIAEQALASLSSPPPAVTSQSVRRPADIATNGVKAVQTAGIADTWTATPPVPASTVADAGQPK